MIAGIDTESEFRSKLAIFLHFDKPQDVNIVYRTEPMRGDD